MPSRSVHDTRLLSNLIKTEKDAQLSFKAWNKDANSASAALTAWSVADSGETQDLMDASHRISQLLASFAESQRNYIHALTAYRTSLKDILNRENALRTVVRDREILVGRIIKLGNKKPSDSSIDKHQQQLDDAHRELAGCETFLQEEEALLNEAKRKSFRDALAMKMQAMADLGHIMEDSSHEAIEILSQLGEGTYTPQDYSLDRDGEDLASNDGDSMTPSQSASQALSRVSSSSSIADQLDFTVGNPARPHTVNSNGSTRSPRATSPVRAASPVYNGAPPSRQMSNLVPRAPTTRAPPAPRPVMAPVPSAPRPISSYATATETGIPGFEIPKAPVNVGGRRPDQDSSDEEDEQAFRTVQNGIPSGQRSSYYPYDAPPSSVGANRLRRAMSDTSSIGPGGRKRRGSFFGSLASLFKKKDKGGQYGDDDSDVGRGLRHASSAQWTTRTDKNVFAAQRGGGVNRAQSRATTRRDDDSSDDDVPRNLVRVVNDPKMRAKAMSDVGRPMSMAAPKVKKAKRPKRAASDIGVSTAVASLPPPVPMPTITRKEATPAPSVRAPKAANAVQEDSASTVVKKKKKKVAKEEPATLVLSAEKLGIPTTSTPTGNGHLTPVSTTAPAKLSRSNTVTSHATIASATTAGGTIKRKKKAAAAAAAPLEAPDLSASLPSARALHNPLNVPLPLPSDVPATTAKPSAPAVNVAPATPQLESAGVEREGKGAGKVPKSLAATEKRSRKDSARYSNGDWVNHPTHAHATHKAPKTDVVEGEESLMTMVDRAEGGEDRTPSRKYGLATAPTNADAAGLAVPRAPTANGSGTSTPGALAKRKSVRLADGPDSLAPPGPSLSPSSSIRSSASSTPRHGILVNHQPSSPAAELTAKSGASTWTSRNAGGEDDSSDEDEEYKKARKAFSKGTKGMEAALGGRWTSEEKGKGRAAA